MSKRGASLEEMYMCAWMASGLFDQLEAHGIAEGQLIRGRSARVTLEWVKTVPPRPDLRDPLPELPS